MSLTRTVATSSSNDGDGVDLRLQEQFKWRSEDCSSERQMPNKLDLDKLERSRSSGADRSPRAARRSGRGRSPRAARCPGACWTQRCYRAYGTDWSCRPEHFDGRQHERTEPNNNDVI
jgi:hypothetical protein